MLNVTSVMHYGGYRIRDVTSVMHYGGYIIRYVTSVMHYGNHYGTITEVTPRAYTDMVCPHFRSYIQILQYSNLCSKELNPSFCLKKNGENLLIW